MWTTLWPTCTPHPCNTCKTPSAAWTPPPSGPQRVFVFGSRTTYGLAHYMVASLSLLHRDVKLVSGVGGVYPEEIVGCRKGDVCIAFMFLRYQKLMSNMIGWMRQRGAVIILFAAPEHEAVQHLGDIFLCLQSQRTATKDFLVPIAFAVDCLLTSIMAHGELQDHPEVERGYGGAAGQRGFIWGFKLGSFISGTLYKSPTPSKNG